MSTDIDDGLGRRAFLRGLIRTTGIAAVAACAPASEGEAPPLAIEPEAPPPQEPELPDGLQAQHFHVHNRSPLALETRRSAMGAGLITPRSRFFVRNNLPRPDASILDDPDAWALEVAGVAGARTIRLGEIKTLGLEMEAVVIQCSGNGRRFYEHGPSGSQWATGAAGCAMWTGVRVSALFAHLGGVVPGARYLTCTGGEVLPEGVDRDSVIVERSIPIDKASKDAMLVWEMNGEPIPITHGGPLRLVVPGYYGCNQIKYVQRLAATVDQTTAKIQSSGYRLRPIGEKGSPDYPSMWRMPVKSWIHGPGSDGKALLAGPVTFFGVALSGERGVDRVDVSLDGGSTWKAAAFSGPDLGPNAWRAFTFTAILQVGTHTLVSRAVDSEGDVQPEKREENERGYGHNGWADHGLTVQAFATSAEVLAASAVTETTDATPIAKKDVVLSESGTRGKQVFNEAAQPSCTVCHTLADAGSTGAVGPNLDALAPDAARVHAAVTNGVGAMPAFGGLSPEQVADVAAYVAEATGH